MEAIQLKAINLSVSTIHTRIENTQNPRYMSIREIIPHGSLSKTKSHFMLKRWKFQNETWWSLFEQRKKWSRKNKFRGNDFEISPFIPVKMDSFVKPHKMERKRNTNPTAAILWNKTADWKSKEWNLFEFIGRGTSDVCEGMEHSIFVVVIKCLFLTSIFSFSLKLITMRTQCWWNVLVRECNKSEKLQRRSPCFSFSSSNPKEKMTIILLRETGFSEGNDAIEYEEAKARRA